MKGNKRIWGFIICLFTFALLILLPVSGLLLDILISLNLLFAFIILFTALFIKKGFSFKSLPKLALFSAIFNVSINILANRLIFTKGVDFDGTIIRFFSDFFSGSLFFTLIGIIIFTIFIIFQIILITKYSNRVSEVAARFTLDSFQVKLMAIETEYNSGVIDETQAESKKYKLKQEADFYYRMDDAAKFISGSIKINIFFILITILGGILTGNIFYDISIINAISIYFPLIFSNGFLSMIPLTLLSLTNIKLFQLKYLKLRNSYKKSNKKTYEEEPIIFHEPLTLELGYGMVPLVEKEYGAILIESIREMRYQISQELKITIPKIRIIDNAILDPREYCIKIHGEDKGRGIIKNIDLEANSKIITHFTEIIKQNITEFQNQD